MKILAQPVSMVAAASAMTAFFMPTSLSGWIQSFFAFQVISTRASTWKRSKSFAVTSMGLYFSLSEIIRKVPSPQRWMRLMYSSSFSART
ncbi:hypothetical protein D3C76_1708830 [compost metagenome]